MLIHKTREELKELILTLERLPMGGNNLREIILKEYHRQQSIKNMLSNLEVPPPQTTHNSDRPTTAINDYWAMRLGVIRY